jgi:hypothetical protein
MDGLHEGERKRKRGREGEREKWRAGRKNGELGRGKGES